MTFSHLRTPLALATSVHLRAAILALMLLPLVGCATVGMVAYKLSGPEPVPAKYTPAKELTLVLVESFENPSAHVVDAQRLTAQISIDLERQKIVPLVDVDRLQALRDRDPAAFRKMTIPSIGRAVGAKQVLYVNIVELSHETDGTVMRGRTTTMSRFIDTGTGTTLWPTDFAQGFPLNMETPYVRLELDPTGDGVRGRLVREMSDAITKLFYKWTPVEGVK